MERACQGVAEATAMCGAALQELCNAMESEMRTNGISLEGVHTINKIKHNVTNTHAAFSQSAQDWVAIAQASATPGMDAAVALSGIFSVVDVILRQLVELHRDTAANLEASSKELKVAKASIMADLVAATTVVAPPPPPEIQVEPEATAPSPSPARDPKVARHRHGKVGTPSASTVDDSTDVDAMFPRSKLSVAHSKCRDATGVDEHVGSVVHSFVRANGFSNPAQLVAACGEPLHTYQLGGGRVRPVDVFDALFWQSGSSAGAQIASVVVPTSGTVASPVTSGAEGFSHPSGTNKKGKDIPSAGIRSFMSDHGDTMTSAYSFVELKGKRSCLLLMDLAIMSDGARHEVLHVLSASDWGVDVAVYTPKNAVDSAPRRSRRVENGYSVGEAIAEQFVAVAGAIFPPIAEPESTTTSLMDTNSSFTTSEAALDADSNFDMKVREKRRKGIIRKTLGLPFGLGKAVVGVANSGVRSVQEAAFKKHFEELAHEEVVDIFNCALQDGVILRQGYLYATRQWLCFQSTVLTGKFALEFAEIRDLAKKRNFLMMHNAIELTTIEGKSYFLTSFLQRDECHKLLYQLWIDSSGVR